MRPCLRQLPHQGSRRLDHLGRGAQPIALGLSSKKNCGQNQSSYARPPLSGNITLTEKSSPLQRHLNSKSYDAAVARDCRLVCQPGAPIEHNAVWRSHGLPCAAVEVSGTVAVPGLATMPWPGCCACWGRKKVLRPPSRFQHPLRAPGGRRRRLSLGSGVVCAGSISSASCGGWSRFPVPRKRAVVTV